MNVCPQSKVKPFFSVLYLALLFGPILGPKQFGENASMRHGRASILRVLRLALAYHVAGSLGLAQNDKGRRFFNRYTHVKMV